MKPAPPPPPPPSPSPPPTPSLRISSTWLESYRRLMETEYGDEDELVAMVLRKPFQETWQMVAGRDWHALLAGSKSHALIADGQPAYLRPANGFYWFSADVAKAGRNLIGPGQWEVKRTLEIGGVTLVAQVDHVHGLKIQENKTRFGPIDPRDYENSLQWRCYLLVHQANQVQYNVFRFKDPDVGGYCEHQETQSFRFFPYGSMEEEIRGWIESFYSWMQERGITPSPSPAPTPALYQESPCK